MQPMTTSSGSSTATPERVRASITAAAPSSWAGTVASAPPKLPIGVRAPLTMTMRSRSDDIAGFLLSIGQSAEDAVEELRDVVEHFLLVGLVEAFVHPARIDLGLQRRASDVLEGGSRHVVRREGIALPVDPQRGKLTEVGARCDRSSHPEDGLERLAGQRAVVHERVGCVRRPDLGVARQCRGVEGYVGE